MEEKYLVTLEDIAKELGKTKNTISRALRDCPDISKKTKEIVIEKAKEMGYIPNFIAKSLNVKKTNVIALVFPGLTNPIFSVFCELAINILKENKYIPFLHLINNYSLDDITKLMENRCAAIISFVEVSEYAINQCNRFKIPLLILGKKQSNASCFYIDDEKGGKLVAEFFYENSIKSIYISNSSDETSTRRENGFVNYYLSKNIKPIVLRDAPEQIINSTVNLINSEDIGGVFAYSDHLAIHLKQALKRINYPKKVIIFGFDDISSNNDIVIRVNSISYPIKEMILEATQEIINKIQNYNYEIVNKRFDVTLINYYK